MKKELFDLSIYVMITLVCICISLFITDAININGVNKDFVNGFNAFLFFTFFIVVFIPTFIKTHDLLND